MRSDEERVVAAYANWLEGQGWVVRWVVRREVDFVDVYAESGEGPPTQRPSGPRACSPLRWRRGLHADGLLGH
jgi:hypothetical protein